MRCSTADPGAGLIRDTMREAFDVAHGLGHQVPVRIDASIDHSRRALPDFRTSMLRTSSAARVSSTTRSTAR